MDATASFSFAQTKRALSVHVFRKEKLKFMNSFDYEVEI